MFQKLAAMHKEVRSFNYGSLADANDDYIEYPLVFVEVDETLTANGSGASDYNRDDYSADIYFYTKSNAYSVDEASNKINVGLNEELDSVSKMEKIAKQFVFKANSLFEDNESSIEPVDYSIAPLLRDWNDDLNGVRLSMTLRVYTNECGFDDAFDTPQDNDEEYKDVNNL